MREHPSKLLISLATPAGLEPATRSLEGCCSIQLSYGAVRSHDIDLKGRRFAVGSPEIPKPEIFGQAGSGITLCPRSRRQCVQRSGRVKEKLSE